MESQAINRLHNKTSLHAVQVELQSGYDLSPVEAQVLARRVQQLVDEQAGFSRQPGQITYQAIAMDESPGKPLEDCRKVPVHLTVMADEDVHTWANKGSLALRRLRAHRIVYEATMQGGALSQEDVAYILGISLKSVKRVFAYFREQGESLPSRGEIQDMGRGVSHKIPIICKYVQDLSFSRISRERTNRMIAPARACGDSSTIRPVTPCSTISGSGGRRVATAGLPIAISSRAARQEPSEPGTRNTLTSNAASAST